MMQKDTAKGATSLYLSNLVSLFVITGHFVVLTNTLNISDIGIIFGFQIIIIIVSRRAGIRYFQSKRLVVSVQERRVIGIVMVIFAPRMTLCFGAFEHQHWTPDQRGTFENLSEQI